MYLFKSIDKQKLLSGVEDPTIRRAIEIAADQKLKEKVLQLKKQIAGAFDRLDKKGYLEQEKLIMKKYRLTKENLAEILVTIYCLEHRDPRIEYLKNLFKGKMSDRDLESFAYKVSMSIAFSKNEEEIKFSGNDIEGRGYWQITYETFRSLCYGNPKYASALFSSNGIEYKQEILNLPLSDLKKKYPNYEREIHKLYEKVASDPTISMEFALLRIFNEILVIDKRNLGSAFAKESKKLKMLALIKAYNYGINRFINEWEKTKSLKDVIHYKNEREEASKVAYLYAIHGEKFLKYV
jgi:hypothetical protein